MQDSVRCMAVRIAVEGSRGALNLLFSQRAQIGSGRIETPIGFTQYEKDEDVGRRRNEDGD